MYILVFSGDVPVFGEPNVPSSCLEMDSPQNTKIGEHMVGGGKRGAGVNRFGNDCCAVPQLLSFNALQTSSGDREGLSCGQVFPDLPVVFLPLPLKQLLLDVVGDRTRGSLNPGSGPCVHAKRFGDRAGFGVQG